MKHKTRTEKTVRTMILCGIEICCFYNVNENVLQLIVYKFETREYSYDDIVYVFGSGRDRQVEQTGLLSSSRFLTGESLYVYVSDTQFIDLTYEKGTVSRIDACTRTTIFKIRIN